MLLTLFGCVGLGWFDLRLCFGLWCLVLVGFLLVLYVCLCLIWHNI